MESAMTGGGLSERRSLVYNIDTNFWNLFIKYVERVGVERKKRLAFLLAALLLPEAVFAAAGGNDLAMGNAVEYQYSSHITGDRWMHDETTLYFNDGFGRLIEFHLTVEHQMTELSIRQNGCVVWRGHLPGADRFSVVREESMGGGLFPDLIRREGVPRGHRQGRSMERLRVQENGHTGQEPSSGVIIPD